VFDQPGIAAEDLVWVHREQFVHYVQLAHALGDPADWPCFRQDLLRALTAAFGLGADMDGGLTPRQHRALQVLDEIHRQLDPATRWPTFLETLWSRRHDIRPDLP
jgi:hypothetical protein